MQIKVCGLKRPDNIAALAGLNIDFMGFIFYEKSPRNLLPSDVVPAYPGVSKVGVFVNADLDFVMQKVKTKKLDYVQLHGQESVAYCQQLKDEGVKIIKAFSVGEAFDFKVTAPYKNVCTYFLFDTKGKNPGGNGVVFNWEILENYNVDVPFFLSGGISNENVKAIKDLKLKDLYAVDLNSKFEIEPAYKDVDKIKNFIHELRN